MFSVYQSITKKFVEVNLEAESKQSEWCSKHAVKNIYTGEVYQLSYSSEKYINRQYNSILQRLLYNKSKAREEGLIPIFITFTAPSEYHPFKKKPYALSNDIVPKNFFENNKFKFQTIEEAIQEAYQFLNGSWRLFYKRIKSNNSYQEERKKIRYDLVFEFHKSYIPHLHILLYVPNVSGYVQYIEKAYKNVLKGRGMEERANKFLLIETMKEEGKERLSSLDGAVLYISKYIRKALEEIRRDKLQANIFLGWKRTGKIRLYRGSNTDITMEIYQKLYFHLDKKEKEHLLKRAKRNNTCILYELEKITNIYQWVTDMRGVSPKVEKKQKEKKKYSKYNVTVRKSQYEYVREDKELEEEKLVRGYKVEDMKIYSHQGILKVDKLIYNKGDYVLMKLPGERMKDEEEV